MRKTVEDLEDLAVFRGTPAFASPLHVGRPNQGNRERFLARVNEMLDRNWLTNNGPFVEEFEARIAAKVDVKHCVAFANGTMALEVLIEAMELSGEVIVPSFTFIATVHALQRRGLIPVFATSTPIRPAWPPGELRSASIRALRPSWVYIAGAGPALWKHCRRLLAHTDWN
jgi:hypothetical protein